jgi:hypothetical protein
LDREQLNQKVHMALYNLLNDKNYIAPVDLLISSEILKDKDYKNWRFGRVPYLERVCNINLKKLCFIIKELRVYARNNDLKESWTAYNRWGIKGKKIPLRFSKTGNPKIERAYATHYMQNQRE